MIILNKRIKRDLVDYLRFRPNALADIEGNSFYPDIEGKVKFYQTEKGVIVKAEIKGLPRTKTNIFTFHIHAGESCTGNRQNPFSDTGGHYNPTNMPHPMHAGDLPPLFSNDGFAWQAFLTNRFEVKDIVNRTILVHIDPDDFKTQPAGDAGTAIACGEIKRN